MPSFPVRTLLPLPRIFLISSLVTPSFLLSLAKMLPPVLVSCDRCNKLPQTCLKTTQTYHSSRGQKSNMGLTGLQSRYKPDCIFSGPSRESSFSSLFQLLEAAFIPSLRAPSLYLQRQKCSISPLSNLCSHPYVFSL